MAEDDHQELAALYAVDALDPEEASAFERHLAGCQRCREELPELEEAAAALAYGVEGPQPPPGLRDRILVAARAERGNVVLLRRRLALPAAAALAAAVALGLGLWAVSLQGSLDSERAARSAQARALAILTEPGTRELPLSGAKGSLVLASSRRAVLVVRDVGPAPEGKAYQAWVIQNGAPEPAGIFAGGPGGSILVLTRTVPPGASVGVTLERAGGVDEPSGPILVRVRVA